MFYFMGAFMTMSRLQVGFWGTILCCSALSVARPAEGGYHLLKKYELGAAPGGQEYWDYITFDEATRRLFVSHNSEVKVVNADTGAIVGSIADLKRVHGTALVSELGRGFLSDGGADEVVVFDLQTLKVIGHIKTGGNPDCIIYDPVSKHIFTFNGRTNDASVIDPRTETVVATIAMGGRPEYAVADGRGTIYDNIEDKNEIAVLDTRTNSVKTHWPIAPAAEATSIALDVKHHRLFAGGRNKVLAILNTDSGKVVQTFPIGAGVDANIFDPKSGNLFVSVREGILHIFHEESPDHFLAVEEVKTEFGARNAAYDAKTQRIFLSSADFTPAAQPTPDQPNPQPVPISGTFRLLVYGR